jgi:diguanylate cyclase (GGDEF)-like protein/PAS domain S-box-containing protein
MALRSFLISNKTRHPEGISMADEDASKITVLKSEVATLNELLAVQEAVIIKQSARVAQTKQELSKRIQELQREIAKRKKAVASLLLAAKVLQNSGESVLVTDAENNIISVNRAFTEMTGYLQPEILGKNPRILKSEHHEAAFYAQMWKSIVELGHWHGEVWNRRKNGDVFPQWVNIHTIKNSVGEIINYFAMAADLTQRKEAEERIQYLAYYDALTGLPNRILLRDRLQQAISNAKRTQTQVGVMFLDLNRFKSVNDSLGHIAGDLLLQEAASRLRAVVRESDTVARMGGDEFVIALSDGKQPEDALAVGKRIHNSLDAPFPIEGHAITISTSIGISLYPGDGKDADELLKNADVAMYDCKRNGPAKYRFFTGEMNEQINQHLLVEHELRQALARGELVLHFQPQVNARTGRILGAEALVRWQHPSKGLLLPGLFIPIAEESDLIIEIGKWALREACRWNVRRIQGGSQPACPVAVNIAAAHIRMPDFKDHVFQALAESGLPPHLLEVELTESAFLRDTVVDTLTALKKSGVRLSIDDFGTGYSSLSYLQRFRIDRLKIDQSFVRDLPASADSAAIVTAIIQMAKSLRLDVIAEGVETHAQMAFLREHGCDEVQGFLFGKPLPGDEFIASHFAGLYSKTQPQARIAS